SIAGVESSNNKTIINVMKKTEIKTKKTFPSLKNCDEIKSSETYTIIKDYYYRKIVSKDIKIRYVTSDLFHVREDLLEDENLLYNYMLQFIVVPVAKKKGVKQLDLYLDKRTIKVK